MAAAPNDERGALSGPTTRPADALEMPQAGRAYRDVLLVRCWARYLRRGPAWLWVYPLTPYVDGPTHECLQRRPQGPSRLFQCDVTAYLKVLWIRWITQVCVIAWPESVPTESGRSSSRRAVEHTRRSARITHGCLVVLARRSAPRRLTGRMATTPRQDLHRRNPWRRRMRSAFRQRRTREQSRLALP